ncbi:MAG: polysaccharide deacetylase family protein [Micromonosporaceae bacterium]|nr:polysaccharide deacetylase family protein [Micromonosporaceae bacterium]
MSSIVGPGGVSRPALGTGSRRSARPGRTAVELLIACAILILSASAAKVTGLPGLDGLVAGHGQAGIPGRSERSEDIMVDLSSHPAIRTDNRCVNGRIMLTFEDGPDRYTRSVLAVLRAYRAPSTFFVLGGKASERPDLIRAQISDRHVLASHGWSHVRLADLSQEELREQLAETQRVVVQAGAPEPTVLRPPYGSQSAAVEAMAGEFGLRLAGATLDAGDAAGRTVDEVVRTVVDQAKPDAIVVLHDGSAQGETTVRALGGIIDGLRARGFCTATMS